MGTLPYPGADIIDQLDCLKEAGFTEAQAKAQIKAMQNVVKAYDEATRKELATKTDLANAKNEILTWMIALIIALAGVLIGAMSYFKP